MLLPRQSMTLSSAAFVALECYDRTEYASAKTIDGLIIFRCFCFQVAKTHHGLLLQDFANTILHGQTQGVTAADSLGESLTAMAIYRANESGEWEDVFVEAAAYAEPASARL